MIEVSENEDKGDVLKDLSTFFPQVVRPSVLSVLLPRVNRSQLGLRLFAVLGLILIGVIYNVHRLDVDKLTRNQLILSTDPDTLSRALVFAPTSWQVWYYFGR